MGYFITNLQHLIKIHLLKRIIQVFMMWSSVEMLWTINILPVADSHLNNLSLEDLVHFWSVWIHLQFLMFYCGFCDIYFINICIAVTFNYMLIHIHFYGYFQYLKAQKAKAESFSRNSDIHWHHFHNNCNEKFRVMQ